jgi:murein DD-endopeptidase
MREPMSRCLRRPISVLARSVTAAVLSVLAIGGHVSSQESVDLSVLQPAAVVRVQGASYLVHELWITNRGLSAVTLNDVAVLDGARTIAIYQQPELVARVGRPGLPRTHPTPLLLEPNQPAVVYFWIRLDGEFSTPRQLQHRVSLSQSSASGTKVLDGGRMNVAPPDAAEILDAPLRGPGWVAVYDPLLVGGHRTAVYTVDGRPRIPGRFAIDWIRLLPTGRVHTDATARPADWNGFGAEVLAVKDARVAVAVDGRPDADLHGKPREAITRENAAGNYIVLDLGNDRFAFYEHLQQGSVRVKVGQRVSRRESIARVGSSGSVSSGPHLHFHVSDAASPLGAEGLPFVLRQFQLRGAFASISSFAKGDAPLPRAANDEPTRALERPGPNVVMDFEPFN